MLTVNSTVDPMINGHYVLGVRVLFLSLSHLWLVLKYHSLLVTSRWKQWWRRSPNTCCSKRILLLLVWQALFYLLQDGVLILYSTYLHALMELSCHTSIFLSYSFAPFIGWLADVRFGRYEVIKFGSIALFSGQSIVLFCNVRWRKCFYTEYCAVF